MKQGNPPMPDPLEPVESLYVHVPFCRAKCGYCAFYSTTRHTAAARTAYLARVAAELTRLERQESPLSSIFVGGGTPSVLSAAELHRLLQHIAAAARRTDTCEWTVEANPESLTTDKVHALRDAGVNRVSLGVQSFNQHHRHTLQRQGSLDRLDDIVEALSAAGIDNLTFDLIYAIPGQTPEDLEHDLQQALAYPLSHLATYALTLEEQSALAQTRLHLPDDDTFLAMWSRTERVLAKAGFKRYEVSNFSRPDRECRHNVSVWHGGTYLGVGPAAASFDGRMRWSNPDDVDAWLAGAAVALDPLSPAARAAEILAFGLRTVAGWTCRAFRERTGFDAYAIRGNSIAESQERGLLNATSRRLWPTAQGLLFNDVLLETML